MADDGPFRSFFLFPNSAVKIFKMLILISLSIICAVAKFGGRQPRLAAEVATEGGLLVKA